MFRKISIISCKYFFRSLLKPIAHVIVTSIVFTLPLRSIVFYEIYSNNKNKKRLRITAFYYAIKIIFKFLILKSIFNALGR